MYFSIASFYPPIMTYTCLTYAYDETLSQLLRFYLSYMKRIVPLAVDCSRICNEV